MGAAISSGTYAVKASDRDTLTQRASGGDAQAQYELGRSWCCMGPGFDTQTATQWFCRAAARGHPAALFELGRIYQGDVSRTPAPGQKLVKMIRAKSEPAHALAFMTLASEAGHGEASDVRKKLFEEANAEVRRSAESLKSDFSNSCEYESVFR